MGKLGREKDKEEEILAKVHRGVRLREATEVEPKAAPKTEERSA